MQVFQNKKKLFTLALFLFVFAGILVWLMQKGSLILSSSDAADIWQTITTYYTDNRYPSYVLYKGISSVYPYVWLYQLAVLIGTGDFFFIMVFHALLFAYITVLGLPRLVAHLTGHEARFWQRLALAVVCFVIWAPTYALSQIMVDLPSCAVFVLAANCAIALPRQRGWTRVLWVVGTGLLCGYCANISGQYSIAALCLLIYAMVQLIPLRVLRERTRRYPAILAAALLVIGMGIPSLANTWFQKEVLDPFASQGHFIAPANAWLERGLIFMIDKDRLFYGNQINSPRGEAILSDYYGEEQGTALMEQAAQGTYGWSIKDYFSVALRYPLDFIVQYIDRLFLCFATDMRRQSVAFLAMSFTMLYLAIVTATDKIRTMRQFFCANFWLVAGALASVIPLLVLTVEMRCALSLQGLVFGVALLGPMLPQIGAGCWNGILQCRENGVRCLGARAFPWKLLLGVAFVAGCLTHMGTLYAQSDLGTAMLFQWW